MHNISKNQVWTLKIQKCFIVWAITDYIYYFTLAMKTSIARYIAVGASHESYHIPANRKICVTLQLFY